MTDRLPLPREVIVGRVVAIARRQPLDRLRDIADILAEEDIRVIEVTLDQADALAAIEALAGDGWCVGAGTVLMPSQVVAAADAGAAFVVSPHTDAETVRASRESGVPVMPGAMTPTEVVEAWHLGASAIKLFPASIGGPAYLRGLRAPLADIAIVPTGGIDDRNAAAYLEAGAVAVGVGGWLTGSPDLGVVRDRARSLRTVLDGG